MIRLFIENTEVELDNTVQFAITKQFEDLTNPTTIINDWSKTISIPFTQKNNELFGHIYSPDKVIVEGGTVGIYFNPLLKLNFRLEWNNAVLMTGYAKMNEVKQTEGKGTYEITLFGQLGRVFQEMQKITLDKSDSGSTYFIDGSKYISEYITKELVYNSWTSAGQTNSNLVETTDSGYTATNILGFAPNNSFNEGFDYKAFQNATYESKKFEDVLNYKNEEDETSKNFYDYTGVEADTAIPNGMLPREIGEYRSYQQLPFVYWNKLFQVFNKKAEEVTGYEIVLENEWFNVNNPYWYNLVYMLKPLNTNKMEQLTNVYNFTESSDIMWNGTNMNTNTQTTTFMAYESSVEAYPIINGFRISPALFKLEKNYSIVLNSYFPLKLQFDANYVSSQRKDNRLSKNNALEVEVCFYNNSANTKVVSNKFLVCDEGYTGATGNYTQIYYMGVAEHLNGYYDVFNIPLNVTIPAFYKTCGEYARLELHAKWKTTNAPFVYGSSSTYSPQHIYLRDSTTSAINLEVLKDNFKSYSYFTLNDLWDNEHKLFDEVLKYCKMFRIGVFVDDVSKKINFISLPRYFGNYTVSDWTNKVDKSKDFTIKPITFEDKYVLFNYEDNETKLGADYKEKYGVNYGDYKLTTDYNFNSQTNKLFKGITASITSTDNVLSWTNLNDYHKIIYSFPNEFYINCKDKDKKFKTVFGAFYYHNGLFSFSTEASLRLRPVKISDDTPFQQGNQTYFYSQAGGSLISCSSYPRLDIVNDTNLCVFNVPMENYTYTNNYSNKNSIYKNLWENYINERYNIQNKQITCYMDIKPSDYTNFDFNHFVKIGNQLCMVNKIYDYDVTSTNTTKVDLVTIQDIHGYTDNKYLEDIDTITLNYTGTTYLSGSRGSQISINTFTSISDVTFANGNKFMSAYGMIFSITGNQILVRKITTYIEEEDLEFTITIKNRTNHTATMNIVRYSVYPYPYVSITDVNDNVVTSLTRNTTYKLNWERTPTDTLENKPTVQFSNVIGGNYITEGNDWTVEEKMYAGTGGDEYFLQKYSETLTIGNPFGTGTFTVTITDKEGWYQAKTYNVV